MMATLHQQPVSIETTLAILPSLPRPVLSRLVTRMIERLDQIDGDDEREEDDEDHRAEENGEVEEGGMNPAYGIDQSFGALLPKTLRATSPRSREN